MNMGETGLAVGFKSLRKMSFVDTFSQDTTCLFILLRVSFENILNFDNVQFITFKRDHAFGVIAKQSLPNSRSQIFFFLRFPLEF